MHDHATTSTDWLQWLFFGVRGAASFRPIVLLERPRLQPRNEAPSAFPDALGGNRATHWTAWSGCAVHYRESPAHSSLMLRIERLAVDVGFCRRNSGAVCSFAVYFTSLHMRSDRSAFRSQPHPVQLHEPLLSHQPLLVQRVRSTFAGARRPPPPSKPWASWKRSKTSSTRWREHKRTKQPSTIWVCSRQSWQSSAPSSWMEERAAAPRERASMSVHKHCQQPTASATRERDPTEDVNFAHGCCSPLFLFLLLAAASMHRC